MEKIDKFNEIITKPYKGRISRIHFIIAFFLILLSIPVFILLLYKLNHLINSEIFSNIIKFICFALLVFMMVAMKIIATRRGQDYSTRHASLLFPLLPVSLFTFFRGSDKGKNEYGEEPVGSFVEEVILYKSAPKKINPITHKMIT
ncbi:MAG: DUF805 domain-containing protein [Candidatus Taylorbacteria bacterium]